MLVILTVFHPGFRKELFSFWRGLLILRENVMVFSSNYGSEEKIEKKLYF